MCDPVTLHDRHNKQSSRKKVAEENYLIVEVFRIWIGATAHSVLVVVALRDVDHQSRKVIDGGMPKLR